MLRVGVYDCQEISGVIVVVGAAVAAITGLASPELVSREGGIIVFACIGSGSYGDRAARAASRQA